MTQKTLLITGAAGYVGSMLADQCVLRDDVREVVCLDKDPMPPLLRDKPKIFWIQANTSDNTWQDVVRVKAPEIIIHAAWHIREMYGMQGVARAWNVVGSANIFDMAFREPSVKTLVHVSTIASYGAYKTNSLERGFTEDEPLRSSDYTYAEEKRVVEESLRARFESEEGGDALRVAIVRPASITGPRGRARGQFGLQSVLGGKLSKDSLLSRGISFLMSRVPVTHGWLRQYVHEDDIVDIILNLAFVSVGTKSYEVYNAAPPGPPVLGEDMARAVHKKLFRVSPWVVRLVFFWAWHLTQGRIPTGPGVWRGYSYPIRVDGSRITRNRGFTYRMESWDAFTQERGRYLS